MAGVIHNNKDGTYTQYTDDDYDDSVVGAWISFKNLIKYIQGKPEEPMPLKPHIRERIAREEARNNALIEEIRALREEVERGGKNRKKQIRKIN